jgi:probable addiction module antidote protein
MRRRAKLKTIPWDSAKYLKTDEDIAEYLDVVFEDGDPEAIRDALGQIVRIKGTARIAKSVGLERENLSEALSARGHLEWATVLKVIGALGLKLKVAA